MQHKGWEFVGDKGEFILKNPTMNNYLYFPLVNESGMKSSITPSLHGDINISQNAFVTEPVSAIDLHNKKTSRNFWLLINNEHVWSATGNSAKQEILKFDDEKREDTLLKAGFLYHKVIRENEQLNIKSEITNFVPPTDDKVELMKVKITNIGNKPLKINATSAIPLYGRSADNIRDHRHVTSLLNIIKSVKDGIIMTPTLSFNERGHKINDLSYMVLGKDEMGNSPIGFYPVLEDFIGEGGSLTWPKVVVENNNNYSKTGDIFEGNEAVGALKFKEFELKAKEEKTFILAIIVANKDSKIDYADKYCNLESFNYYLDENKKYWDNLISKIKFNTSDKIFDNWMKWVTIQPNLRRLFGNSFLPHHDYGRGGRGWRDLWQDALSLVLIEPESVREILFNNFAGIRIDGSNATIIGTNPGEFKADRNGINRAWMDHGVWPFITTKLYIDRSGDLAFLLKEQSYFRDAQLNRSNKIDESWSEDKENVLKDKNNNIYYGTLLEHILVQHLSMFFNVGENNNLRLEGGDWNDGLDMAQDKGESVAFTGLYASNMLELANLLGDIKNELDLKYIQLAEEMNILLDTLNSKIDYNSVKAKNELLNRFFKKCESNISGNKAKVKVKDLISDLERKGNSIKSHIKKNEWIENKAGYKWYNGYYDNNGSRLEGDHPLGVRMTLTGQVFSIMSGIASDRQINEIIRSASHYLKEDKVGGYRLNTNFKEIKLDMGRAFGFAYGEKENGAMFSHMAIMFSNALYKRNFSKDGFEVINSIYNHCKKFEKSRIFPGIPEYIDSRGRGLYHYLTGSASWLLLTMINQVYGIQGKLGNLMLAPKLVETQFNTENLASIEVYFAGKKLKIIYNNQNLKPVSDCSIKEIKINNKNIEYELTNGNAIIKRNIITGLESDKLHKVDVTLN